MTHDIKTFELAKVYENQAHYKEAFEIYSFLDKEQTSHEIRAGLKRMEQKIKEESCDSEPKKSISQKDKISILLEKWLDLMILKQRLNNFKRIKARLL
ncbi:MAG: hypothetical protein GY870_05180 [archaeon]|nr:hypothetical protein [archaeon]